MPWRESAAELDRARAERPVVVHAPRGEVFGILTPPAPEAAPRGLCVVFFTRPRSHRNRMWVEAARRLAARGHACFRFDYHGNGDSTGESGFLNPNDPYRDDAVAVLRHLRRHEGRQRFALAGSCFDARTALSAFAEEGAHIEALAFLAAPVVELQTLVKVDAGRKDWKHLARALRNPDNWKALGSLERWRYMATVTGRVARRSVVPGAGDLALGPGFLRDFEALVRSKARTLFLYGDRDAEYESFRIAEQRLFPRLPEAARARFEIEVWPGEVHGLLDVPVQRRALERVLAWIESLAEPASAGTPADAQEAS
jgi:pimeloyl-ACP methyl ester carboxylesterase